MGLLEQEIKELRQMNQGVLDGKIKPAEVNSRIAIYSQIEKRAKMILQAYALGAKFGHTHVKKLSNTQLIGDGAVIDMSDTENERINCPDQGVTITRLGCEDYSSRTKNMSTCRSCPNFKTTRRLLHDSVGAGEAP
jgi:hypothetical protein